MGLLFPLPNNFFLSPSPDSRDNMTSHTHYPGDSRRGYLYCLPTAVSLFSVRRNKVHRILCLCVFLFFSPSSYPYSEDSSQGKQYMNTRCPAWCDRILLSASARDLVLKVSLRTGLFFGFYSSLVAFHFLGSIVLDPPPPLCHLTDGRVRCQSTLIHSAKMALYKYMCVSEQFTPSNSPGLAGPAESLNISHCKLQPVCHLDPWI